MDVEDGEAVEVWVAELVCVAMEVIGAVVALAVDSMWQSSGESHCV